MSRVLVFSDPHFGHEKLAIHRGFSSAKEQDELIIENWNKTIHKRDTVYLLGDITMEKDNYSILKELNGTIKMLIRSTNVALCITVGYMCCTPNHKYKN